MTEPRPTNEILVPSPETSNGPRVIYLHNEALDLVPGAVFERSESGPDSYINGAVIAKLRLPAETNNKGGKEIAVVDFGEFEGKGPYIAQYKGNPQPGYGRTKSRFALMGINYKPESHDIPYAALETGKNLFGREESLSNFTLSLQNDQAGNRSVSKQHFSIEISPEGELKVIDHSTNGTEVELPGETRKSGLRKLGERALKRFINQ